ncbi:MAG: hypothetical protein EOP06_04970 [Proteobacteria bacterium]|nr:MAG: hypothetical protein EOP06_04970 [Pseudomonadota bacterium]
MSKTQHLIAVDDRETVSAAVRTVVGERTYGEIIIKRKPLKFDFKELKKIDGVAVFEITDQLSAQHFLNEVEKFASLPVTVLAARSIPISVTRLIELMRRLVYLEKTVFDSDRVPLLAHFKSGKDLLLEQVRFLETPLHLQDQFRNSEVRIDAPSLLNDISTLDAFLKFALQGTEARHFNEVLADEFTYTKRSSNKIKIESEFRYFYLISQQRAVSQN